MFSQLPKLLGRDFVLGFLLPATIFALAHFIALDRSCRLEESGLTALSDENPWLAATGATVVIGLMALILMLLNRSLIRLKEGYGPLERIWNPFMAYQQWRWKRLHRQLGEVDKEIDAAGGTPSRQLLARQIRLHGRAANEFPDAENWLLPTAFGNVIRAFEVYPRVMYGLDSIAGWPRLLAVIPKDFREQVDAARSQVDLWVNVWALSIVFAVECVVLRSACGDLPAWNVAGVALLVAWWSSRRSSLAAVEWGEFVKSAFDVFLPALGEKLKLAAGEDREHPVWWGFSQAAMYRDPGALVGDQPLDDRSSESGDTNSTEPLLTALGCGTRLLLALLRRVTRSRREERSN